MTSDSIFKKRPICDDAFHLTRNHSNKWNEIGRVLSVDLDFREELRCGQYENRSNEDRLELVIHRWIKSDKESVTWELLLNALKTEVSKDALYDGLKYLHQPNIIKRYAVEVELENQPPSVEVSQIDGRVLTEADLFAVLYWTFEITNITLGQVLSAPSDCTKSGIIEVINAWLKTGTASWRCLSQALLSLNKQEIVLRIARCHPVSHHKRAGTEYIQTFKLGNEKNAEVDGKGKGEQVLSSKKHENFPAKETFEEFDKQLTECHHQETVAIDSPVATHTCITQVPHLEANSNKTRDQTSSGEMHNSPPDDQHSLSESTDDTIKYSLDDVDLSSTRPKWKGRFTDKVERRSASDGNANSSKSRLRKSTRENKKKLNLPKKRKKIMCEPLSPRDEEEEEERMSDEDYNNEEDSSSTTETSDCMEELRSSQTSSSQESFDDTASDSEEVLEDEHVEERGARKRKQNSLLEEESPTKRKAGNSEDSHVSKEIDCPKTTPHLSPYFPRVGDKVVYFHQGHELYCEEVEREKPYQWKTQKMPWHKYNLEPQEYCQVRNVEFVGEQPTLCSVTLALLSQTTDQEYYSSSQFDNTSNARIFTVEYHDMAGVLDFLVLASVYDCSLVKEWNPGDRCKGFIDRTYWMGTILSKKPYQKKFPYSHWQCYKVKWDDASIELLSPWEMEPLSAKDKTGDQNENRDKDNELPWLPEARSLLEKLISSDLSYPFLEPVDVEENPNYPLFVSCPMDLTTIQNKLCHKEYSAPKQLISDIKLVFSNAKNYNQPRSQIYKTTCKFQVYFEKKVQNFLMSCTDKGVDCEGYTVCNKSAMRMVTRNQSKRGQQDGQSRVSMAEEEIDELSEEEEDREEQTDDEDTDESTEDGDESMEDEEEEEDEDDDDDQFLCGIYNEKPKPGKVFKLLKDKSADWNELGRTLEVPLNIREGWRKDSSFSNEDCLERVINHWLETECHKPVSWSGLIKVLKSVTFTATVKKVKRFLQTKRK